MAFLKLYGSPTCAYVQRVRMVALEKNILVRLVSMDEKPDSWGALPPRCKPPILGVPGGYIYDSLRISEYLDASYPMPHTLFPRRSSTKAEMREFILTVNDFAEAGFNALVESNTPDIADRRSTVLNEFELVLQRMESKLACRPTQGPYFLGTAFSLADAALVPILDRFRHGFPAFWDFNPLSATPRLRLMLAEAELRPSFQETKLTRRESLAALSEMVGRNVLLSRAVVRVTGDAPTDARVWLAATMAGIDADLRVVKDATLPRASYNGRHVHDSTNAMLYLLEAIDGGVSLMPATPYDMARAQSLVDQADAVIDMISHHQATEIDTRRAAEAAEKLIRGRYACGATRTFADAAILPLARIILKSAAFHNLNTESLCPKLAAYYAFVTTSMDIRQALERVMPSSAFYRQPQSRH